MPNFKDQNLMTCYDIKDEDFKKEINEPFHKFMTVLDKDTQEKKNLEPIKEILDMISDESIPEYIRITFVDLLVADHLRLRQQSDALRALFVPIAQNVTEQYMNKLQAGIQGMAENIRPAPEAVEPDEKVDEKVDNKVVDFNK